MIKMRRIATIIATIIVGATVFVGCGTKEVGVKYSSADEALKMFNEYNVKNDTKELAKTYADTYLDATGFDLGTVQNILYNNRKGLEVLKSEVLSVEDVNDTTKKATISITSKYEDKENTQEYTYAVLEEEGGWAVSPDGIIACENYDVAQFEKNTLNLRLAKKITLLEGGILRINVYNSAKKEFTFGTDTNKCNVVIETTTGTYSTVMDEPVKVEKKLNSYFMARKDDLSGDILKVTVTNIYELDKEGNAIPDTVQDYIVYQK